MGRFPEHKLSSNWWNETFLLCGLWWPWPAFRPLMIFYAKRRLFEHSLRKIMYEMRQFRIFDLWWPSLAILAFNGLNWFFEAKGRLPGHKLRTNNHFPLIRYQKQLSCQNRHFGSKCGGGKRHPKSHQAGGFFDHVFL